MGGEKMEKRNDEIINFLFNVMNGTEKDILITKEKDENNNPIAVNIPVNIATRMKAAELLFKNTFDNKNTANDMPVIISENI